LSVYELNENKTTTYGSGTCRRSARYLRWCRGRARNRKQLSYNCR